MFVFGKKFCAASLSLLALSFNLTPKVSGMDIFKIVSGVLGCACGAAGAACGTFGIVKASGENKDKDDDRDKTHNILLCVIGGALIIPGVTNIWDGVTANSTKKDIKKLSDELKTTNEKLDNLVNLSKISKVLKAVVNSNTEKNNRMRKLNKDISKLNNELKKVEEKLDKIENKSVKNADKNHTA